MTDQERFWAQVSPDADSCWTWTGKTIRGGYGDFRVSVDGRLRHIIAHRWAWEDAHGPIPSGMLVLHRCDNPPCVNPAHLFLGTQQDNMDDQAAKGRRPAAKGADNKHARLSVEDVAAIRRLVNEERLTLAAVAARFGISRRHVAKLADGEAWSHVPLATAQPARRRGRPRKHA